MNTYQALSNEEELLGKQLVNIAFTIHKTLGPGLLDSVYEKCFCHELRKRNIPFARQQLVEIIYDGAVIGEGLRIDILVNDAIIVELKAQENYHPVWEAQLLSYLKLTNNRLGFIFNFHVPLMKDGIKRMIL
ncbi:MAG: GxxExxY protein [Chitinophagaceae bacterium]|nr:GxxExxY protein [Chitinophagaceae bacterium]